MFKIISNFLKVFINKFLFRTKYENLEILEKFPKCMLCSNHSRIFDPTFIYPKVENMYSVAKSEVFKHKLIGDFLSYHGAIPIKRDSTDKTGIMNIIKLFNENENVRILIFPEGGIFPEGTRNGMAKGVKPKEGAVKLAIKANVPIIPIHITVRPKFFSKVVVKFGDPFYANPNVLKDRKELRKESKRLINYIYDI